MAKRFTILSLVLGVLISVFPTLTTQADTLHQTLLPSKTGQVVAVPDNTGFVRPVWVTAYSSTPAQTKPLDPFTMANGDIVHDGAIAANFLPFGTKVQIPALFGKKVFTVEDRMSRKKTNFVDIWMSTTSAAIAFGIHYTDIVVLE